MAVKASATITLTQYRDTQSVTRYYKLQPAGSSAPSKPETKPPSSDWTDSEPACDISKELYFCDLTIFSNGEWEYSSVSKSTSYEAAKQAYNKADNAQTSIDNLEIGGRNLLPDTDFGGASKKYIVPDGVVEGSGGEGGFQFTPTIQIESGVEYTLSLRMRGHANVNFYELNTGGNMSHRIATRSYLSETDYKKISLTFVVRADRTFQRVFICTAWGLSATGDWFEIEPKSLKLEKGNKATDWTPAPEDVDAGIANATGVATNYIHADGINGLVVNNNQTVGVGYDVQLKADGSNTGMNIRQDGEILASFLQNSVSLGKNSINSKVGMCGDKGGVSASFGYYIDSVTSNNAEMGSTLSFDFNETTFKNKVGQTTGFYEFTYTSADGWKLFDPVNDTSYAVTLSQYGITMKTPTSSIKDHAGITINYVLDGSVKFYNADISNPVRKLELEMAENPSSSESDFANITIERQSGTYANGDGKEHSIITMMTLHEFANVATLQLFDDDISLNATHLYLTSSYGDGSIQLDGDTNINGNLVVQGDNLVSKIQAMFCAAYQETLTVDNGTFTNDGSNASLVGNSLYLHIIAKAKAAITAGNIANQTMLTITFTDNRISVLYSVSGSGGASGPNSQMMFTGASSGGQHTITVRLAAIAQNLAKGGVIDAKVSIPCVLNWDAY